ncbi:hypothetical protein ACSS6W_009214 [Trichoderma asperelloides]
MRRPPITLYNGPQVSDKREKIQKFFFQTGSRVGAKALNLCVLRFAILFAMLACHASLPCLLKRLRIDGYNGKILFCE